MVLGCESINFIHLNRISFKWNSSTLLFIGPEFDLCDRLQQIEPVASPPHPPKTIIIVCSKSLEIWRKNI